MNEDAMYQKPDHLSSFFLLLWSLFSFTLVFNLYPFDALQIRGEFRPNEDAM